MVSVLCCMATCGRNYLANRALTCFVNQDYEGPHTLIIYNNSPIIHELDIPLDIPKNKTIILINNCVSKETNKPYSNLGEIYRDISTYFVKTDIITHWDDDDYYLKNHISEGVRGYLKAKKINKVAYKPKQSWFKYDGKYSLTENTLEPSIFVEYAHITKYSYSNATTEQHLKWVTPLVNSNKILVDVEGIPTLIYDWNSPIPTFKTSGNPTDPENFKNYRKFSKNFGDAKFKLLSKEEMNKYEDSSLYISK